MSVVKNFLVGSAVIVGGLIYLGATAEPVSESIQAANLKACYEQHGEANIKGVNKYTERMECKFTDAYKEQLEVAKAKAKELEEAKKAEADAIAKAEAEAFAKSPEGKTKKFLSQASSHCMRYTRDSAKFPNKVDFDWMGGNSSNYWMNFNDNGDSRVMIVRTGEMMNGLGMMVPFKSVCKYDFNPEKNSFKMIEFLI